MEETSMGSDSTQALRAPRGITIFRRQDPTDPYLWRDESVGEEPEEGERRECARDVYEALGLAIDCPMLRQASALDRAAEALGSVGHDAAKALREEAEAIYGSIPAPQRAQIESAEAVLKSRKLSAEEMALLRRAWFWA